MTSSVALRDPRLQWVMRKQKPSIAAETAPSKIGGALENFEDLIAQVDRNQSLYRHDKEVSLVCVEGRPRDASVCGQPALEHLSLAKRLWTCDSAHCSSRVNQEIADLLEELRGVIEEARPAW